jgi:hypothetical protein
MKIVGYLSEENDKLYDFDTLRRLVGSSKSKLHRDLHKLEHREFVKYKNQFLYTEKTMFEIMEKVLFEKLDKIKNEQYEFSNDKKH